MLTGTFSHAFPLCMNVCQPKHTGKVAIVGRRLAQSGMLQAEEAGSPASLSTAAARMMSSSLCHGMSEPCNVVNAALLCNEKGCGCIDRAGCSAESASQEPQRPRPRPRCSSHACQATLHRLTASCQVSASSSVLPHAVYLFLGTMLRFVWL